jgi:signal transduction histidine kinase/ActR/RegA family two-component response regulator
LASRGSINGRASPYTLLIRTPWSNLLPTPTELRAAGAGGCHSIIHVYIDRLHVVNETFGYKVGDELTVQLAHLLEPVKLSRCALAARVSGGALALVLMETDVYVATSEVPLPRLLASGGLRALVIAPLLAEAQVFGVLIAARRQLDSFTRQDCEFLAQLSEHVALAAHQAQLHGALQHAYDDLRQSQETLMQQERLRALGQMASGIAHDINNSISPIALYAESLLEREPSLSVRTRSCLIIMQRAIQDVSGTVDRMREFCRPREPQLQLARVELNRLVEQVVSLTRARWSDLPQQRGVVIDLLTDLAVDLPDIMGAEGEIRDALTNLIFNAVDAMPEGGTLTVCTRAITADTADTPSADHVRVEVSDTGMGMDEDTRRHCIEPFYTTKGERGTGLGLAMVYGMTQRHSAGLEIESVQGKGTRVRLTFPVSTSGWTSTPRLSQTKLPAQPLHILLVDDDPLLSKSLQDILEGDGHVVTAADGGQKGIDVFIDAQKSDNPFAVVITDLGMPHVDGRRVAASIKMVSPTTPVILLTGWGKRLLDDGVAPTNVDYVLSKPPRIADIRTALAELSTEPARESPA